MAKDVDAALRKIIQEQGGKTEQQTKRVRRKTQKRQTLQTRRVLNCHF